MTASALPPECEPAIGLMRQALIDSGLSPDRADQLLRRAEQYNIRVEGVNAEERVRRIRRNQIRDLLLQLAEAHSIPPSRVAEILAAAGPCFAPTGGPAVELDVVVEDGSGRWPLFDPEKELFQVGEQGDELTYHITVSNRGSGRVENLAVVNLMTSGIVAFQAIDNVHVDFNGTSTVLGQLGSVFSESAPGFVFWLEHIGLDPEESVSIIFSGIATAPGVGIDRVLVTVDELATVAIEEEPTHVLFGTCNGVSVSARAGGTVLMTGDGLDPVQSGILVDAGDEVLITATGSLTIFGSEPNVTTGPNGLDFDAASAFTFLLPDPQAPDGESAHVAGSLIGRIGTGGFFYVGESAQFFAPAAGEIELAVNDIEGFFSDNLGGFEATVCVAD